MHLLLLLLVSLAACASPRPVAPGTVVRSTAEERTGPLITDTLLAPSLQRNLAGDSGTREVVVYLPPGYEQDHVRRYPTVYLLHGGRMSNRAWAGGGGYREWPDSAQALSVPRMMDSLVTAGVVHPMILVMPDMRDRFDGSWYTNSPVTGNWEDYLTRDLVDYVDAHYRTIRDAAARGITGHSLGGFGAIRTAMRHPETFGAVYALSPCCLGLRGELGLESPEWRRTLQLAEQGDPLAFKNDRGPFRWAFHTASLAFTPDSANPPLHVSWPVAVRGDSVVPVEPIASRWLANAPLSMARRYAPQLRQLRGIAFDNGTHEPLPHIARDTRALADTLARLGIRRNLRGV
jgi:S-formylglutathione hydrolase